MTLIIGDIHGCYDELQALLDKSGIGDDEDIIALGDLFDKGSQPLEVLDFFTTHPSAYSIRGNQDHKHLLAQANNKPPALEQLITRWQLNERYTAAVNYIESLPLYMELDDAILVHGYYDPTSPLHEQREDVLLGLEKGRKYLKKQLDDVWFMMVNQEKPLIVGHKDYSMVQKPFIIEGRFYAIDTQCVVGGTLTGIHLPQWELISVPTKQNYWASISKPYGTH